MAAGELTNAAGPVYGTPIRQRSVADMSPADIAAHGIPLAVVAQRKVEAAVAKRQQAFRAEQWQAANWYQKEADVWQEVLDILGAQAGA